MFYIVVLLRYGLTVMPFFAFYYSLEAIFHFLRRHNLVCLRAFCDPSRPYPINTELEDPPRDFGGGLVVNGGPDIPFHCAKAKGRS